MHWCAVLLLLLYWSCKSSWKLSSGKDHYKNKNNTKRPVAGKNSRKCVSFNPSLNRTQ
jgi:hypothetical protein